MSAPNYKYAQDIELGRDSGKRVIQAGMLDTANAFDVVNGATSTAFTGYSLVRLIAFDGDCRVYINAVSGVGMLLPDGYEITIMIDKDDTISPVGGSLNVTPYTA